MAGNKNAPKKETEKKVVEQEKTTSAPQQPAATNGTAAGETAIQRTTPVDQDVSNGTTTMQVTRGIKTQIIALQEKYGLPDQNAVVNLLLEKKPVPLSTKDDVHLVMSRQKYAWLLAFQNNLDCSRHLEASVR